MFYARGHITVSDTDDRRSDSRQPIRLKVAYRTANSLVTEYTSSVSRGGCRLTAARPLNIGTTFLLEMYTPKAPRPLSVEGEVVWCNPAGAKYEIGIRYLAADKQREALNTVLDRLFAEHDYEQARLHPRVSVNLPLKDAHRPDREYSIRDLSRGGIGLRVPGDDLPEDLTRGALLVLAIGFPDSTPIELGAEIVWTARFPAAAGAAFVGIGAQQQEALDRLMRLHPPSLLHLTVGAPVTRS